MNSIEPAPYILSYVDQDIEQFGRSGRLPLEIRQLSSGTFNGRTTIITLPDCTLTRRFTGARHATTCWVPPSVTLLFPLTAKEAFIRGRVRGPAHQSGSLGGHEVLSVVPEDFGHLLVTMPLEALGRHLGPSECCIFIETLATIENCTVDEHLKAATTARLLRIFYCIENAPVPLDSFEQKEHCREIVHILFGYLAAHSGRAPERSSNHEKILNRALQLIASRPDACLSLDELARAVFASKRAVQYAFCRVLGLSPMRFQKLYRLNLVRKNLSVARSPLKFAGILSQYAFSNPGRLSREYYELFGERPQDTLREALSANKL